MSLLTVAEFKARVATNLPDDAIANELDAAEKAITDVAGPQRQLVERFDGRFRRLIVSRPIASVVSISDSSGTLGPSEYRTSGYVIERVSTSHWGTLWTDAVVTYEPADDTVERIRVQTALVQLALNHEPGLTSQTNGPFSESYVPDYEAARAQILATLERPAGMQVVR